VTKFCMWLDIQDLITYATFGDNRLRGFGVAGVDFPISPLTCVVTLTTLSHYRASVWWQLLSVFIATNGKFYSLHSLHWTTAVSIFSNLGCRGH